MSAQPLTRVDRPAQRALPLALRAELVAPVLVALGFVLLVALTWGTWGDLAHDTGYDWVAAQRVADGQLPYADFNYIYGPLGIALLGGTFAVLGQSTGAVIALGLVLAAASVALTYRVGRELTGPLGSALAAGSAAVAAVGTGNMSLIVPHATVASVAVAIGMFGVLAGARYAATERRAWLVGVGVATGLMALTRPEFAAAMAIAPAAWLVLRALRGAGLRDAGLWAAVSLAIPAVVYGLLLTKVSPGALLHDNLFPTAQLKAGSDQVLKGAAPMTASSFAKLIGHLVLYAGGAAVLVGAGVLAAKGGNARRAILALAALAALGFLGALAKNPEAIRSRLEYAYAWIPAGAALVAVALAVRSRRGEWTVRDQAAFLLTALLAVVALKTYAAFAPSPNPDFAQFATYALPFAALFMAWLHLEVLPKDRAEVRVAGAAWLAALLIANVALVVKDGRAETMTVSGPGGTISATPAQAPAYQAALDAILKTTRPGDPVLLAPQMTALYTIADRTDPLAAISLLPGTLPAEADEQAAIARMHDVNVVVTDRRALTEYGQGAFGTTYDRRLGAWLRGEFRRVATLRGSGGGAVTLDLWQRSAK